jgi:iron complex transport system ATP-binding protein
MPKLNIFEMKNITVYQGNIRVFRNLSLEIPLGCNTVILGPNGAGKTTLLKLLSCHLYPDAAKGCIRIFGQEQWDVWELRCQLGIISHDLQHEYLSSDRGMDIILSGHYSSIGTHGHQLFSKAKLEKASQVMKKLEINQLKKRLFSEMSTGEQRRFLLGRALIHDPKVLVLDEPTSGLDIDSCFQYLGIIRNLIKDGKTIILVTHHLHEIPPEISRVIFIKKGKIIADGSKKELLKSGKLSNLFSTPVQVLAANGFYQVVPKSRV